MNETSTCETSAPVCCAPERRGASPPRDPEVSTIGVAQTTQASALVELDGGRFSMGTEDAKGFPEDGEGPVREVELSPFAIEAHAVTNRRFADFVDATGYETDAERYGWSFVFAGLLPDSFPETRGVVDAPWWRQVFGATWRCPEGPQSVIEDRLDHPVVHVSWRDAEAFCAWAQLRLPTEAEWEFAARGGLVRKRYPWGDEREPEGEHRMNVWQGRFPTHNSEEDGYYGTCPVGEFPANGYGLHNMSGNVWEWCCGLVSRELSPPGVGAARPQGPAKRRREGHPRRLLPVSSTPTATATGSGRAAVTRRTARPATSASAARDRSSERGFGLGIEWANPGSHPRGAGIAGIADARRHGCRVGACQSGRRASAGSGLSRRLGAATTTGGAPATSAIGHARVAHRPRGLRQDDPAR